MVLIQNEFFVPSSLVHENLGVIFDLGDDDIASSLMKVVGKLWLQENSNASIVEILSCSFTIIMDVLLDTELVLIIANKFVLPDLIFVSDLREALNFHYLIKVHSPLLDLFIRMIFFLTVVLEIFWLSRQKL